MPTTLHPCQQSRRTVDDTEAQKLAEMVRSKKTPQGILDGLYEMNEENQKGLDREIKNLVDPFEKTWGERGYIGFQKLVREYIEENQPGCCYAGGTEKETTVK